MDKIDLETRDRKNIYREDAENVVAVEVGLGECVEINELDGFLSEIGDHMRQRGSRFGYLVIKIAA